MDLFSKYDWNGIELANRVVMAPMTRSRAVGANLPSPSSPLYYTQRASAGLIITEASQISPQGVGYIRTPGIYSAEQVAEWKKTTQAVHAAGGKIVMQLWHVGRISHPDFHGGALPVAPSAILANGEVYTTQGRQKMVTPRALETSEIAGIVDQYKKAAENAKLAGFDGVEIHGANGYLPDQFTRDGSNQRGDRYGGNIANRIRFPLEVAEAVIDVWGAARVGYRVSPHNPYNDMKDSTPVETFSTLVTELDRMGLGYLHNLEAHGGRMGNPQGAVDTTPIFRKLFRGTYIINGGYDAKSGVHAVAEGMADLVAFGIPFISNPDLVHRFRVGAPIAQADTATFYAGDDQGYIDYPPHSG